MLSFLRQLCEHTKPLKVLLVHQESNLTPKSFIETVVMQLTEALQSKSAQFKGRGDLKQLFLANNFGYIANSLPHCKSAISAHSGEADDIEVHIQTEIRPRLERLRDEAIEQFVDGSYRSFQSFLVEPTEKLVYAKGGDLLTLESGRLLKEKFAVRSDCCYCDLLVPWSWLTMWHLRAATSTTALQHSAGRHLQDAQELRCIGASGAPPDHPGGSRRDRPAVHPILRQVRLCCARSDMRCKDKAAS